MTASPGVRALTMSKLVQDLERKRAGLAELRDLIFPRGEPDDTDADWEREAWRIITRTLAEVPR